MENSLSLPPSTALCSKGSFSWCAAQQWWGGNVDQNFLILCFEWLTAVKHIKPFRPGAGGWDSLRWLPPASCRLYQRMAQDEQSLQVEWMMNNVQQFHRPLIQAQQYARQLAAEVDVQMVEYVLGCAQHTAASMELLDGAALMALKL